MSLYWLNYYCITSYPRFSQWSHVRSLTTSSSKLDFTNYRN
jgi:hypothetical protein